jgi:sugar diacid utilization regulator
LTLIARAGRTIRPLNVSVLDGIGAALVQETGGDSLAAGIQTALHERYGPRDGPLRCGISAAVRLDSASDAWDQARIALRFSIWGTAEQAVTSYEGLGPLTLLGELPRDRLEAHPDVVSLQYLERGTSGASDIKVLDVFCHSSSLRGAAQSLHMHHSSVAARLEQIEQALGWELDTPEGRFRTRLAILAHRLVVGN